MPEENLLVPESARTTQPAARSLLVDVVRGLAISLVAIGHTEQGVSRRGWWGPGPFGERLWVFIYEFHMPAFFFVSGIFLASSVARRGPRRFIDAKVAQLIYPYFVWSLLIFAFAHALQRVMMSPVASPRAFLFQLLDGDTLWFLPAVFLCVTLGMLLRNVSKPLLLALALAVALLPVDWHVTFITQTVEYFPYLVAGMWVTRGYERVERISLPVAAGGALLLGVLIYSIACGTRPHRIGLDVVAAFAGISMLFLLARCLQKGSAARVIAWVGEASFGVYVLSAYGQGAGRELLLRGLHTTEPVAQLLFPSVLAIFIPAWIYQHRIRLKLDWLFVWPF